MARLCIEELLCHGFIIQSCVIQGGVHVAVPEQGLQGEDGHACIEQKRGAGMAQLVWGHMNIRLRTVFTQKVLNTRHCKSLTMLGNENRPILSDRAADEPILERLPRWRREASDAMLIAFAVDSESGWIFGKNIFQRKIVDFADAQSAFEHEREHGSIAQVVNV